MNFQNDSQSTSFYEVLSDLIFATMAIFVLIVFILIIQINPDGISQQQWDDAQNKLQQQQKDIEQLEEQVSEQSGIETESLEVVVMVDGSGSMGEPIIKLKQAINDLSEALPLITSQFNLGMIVYRETLDTFPMQQIKASKDDNRRSLNNFIAFTDKIQAINGLANFEGALNKSISMFSQTSGKKALIILGDVGPYETSNPASCDQPSTEQRLVDKISRFANTHENFRLFTLYARSHNQSNCPTQTVNFYQRLANSLQQNGGYSDDVSKLLIFLIHGILGGD